MENTNIKCSNCKKYKIADDFKKNGNILKTCIKCRNSIKNSRIKNKCIHKKNKHRCVECDGHDICIHKKRKEYCKICGDEMKITIKTMLVCSKNSDKKYNRYDVVNFIDKCFVKNLIEDCNDKCYYCKCDLQYIIRQSNLATIERIDNKIGHIKSNCVISCYHCNCSLAGNKIN